MKPNSIKHYTACVNRGAAQHQCEPDFARAGYQYMLMISEGKHGDATSLIARVGDELDMQGLFSHEHRGLTLYMSTAHFEELMTICEEAGYFQVDGAPPPTY